jgi:hypothetical protein
MTHYYSLAGTLTRDGQPITDPKEVEEVVLHWMRMTRDYEHEGFRFVDADAHGTLTEGFLSLNWSDYGLESNVGEAHT